MRMILTYWVRNHFGDELFKRIFNENLRIFIKHFIEFHRINKESALIQVTAWRLIGNKPLPEPTMTHFIDV